MKKMEMNEIKEIARFLFEKQSTAHLDTLDLDFYNGLILELHETFIVLNDRVLGSTPIPFSEIKTIEKFREKEK
jgi:hypothetical protein